MLKDRAWSVSKGLKKASDEPINTPIILRHGNRTNLIPVPLQNLGQGDSESGSESEHESGPDVVMEELVENRTGTNDRENGGETTNIHCLKSHITIECPKMNENKCNTI